MKTYNKEAAEILKRYVDGLRDKTNAVSPQHPNRKHHYIPKFYLELFSNPKTNKLTVVDKIDGKEFAQKADATGYENDFYIYGERQEDDWHVLTEIFWSLVESDTAPIYRKIIQQKQIALSERVVFSLFVSSMICRSRSAIRLIREMAGGVVDQLMRFLAEDEEKFKNIAEAVPGSSQSEVECLREEILNGKIKTFGNQNMSSPTAPSNAVALSPYILHMKWNVCKSTRQVVTSDTPALTFSPQSLIFEKGKIGGLEMNDSLVLLPLAPDCIFICEWGEHNYQIAYPSLSEKQTKMYNNIIVSAADRFVYLAFPYNDIRKFIANRKGTKVVSKIEGPKSIYGKATSSEMFIDKFKP